LFGENGVTAFGISFLPEVKSVEIELRDGATVKHLRKTPRLLSKAQGRKTRLKRFRFLAMAVPYDACVIGIDGFSASGEKILDFESDECRAG